MSKLLANQIANYGDDAPIEIKEGLNIPAGKPIQASGVAGSAGQVLSSTGATIQWITPFDGDYNSLTNTPTIPAAQVPSDWNASGGLARILNKPIVPAQPSVTTTAVGSAALAYNSTNGEFTFTPPDLSNSTNWDTAYGWGNHASVGYLTAEVDTLDSVCERGKTSLSGGGFGVLTDVRIVGTSGIKASYFGCGALGGNSQGDLTISHNDQSHVSTIRHANTLANLEIRSVNSINFYTAISETLRFQVTSQGVSVDGNIALGSGDISTTGKLYYSNNFADLTALNAVNASTYHGMFAHVHAEGHGYFAHAGGWIQMLDTGSSIGELADVDLSTAPQTGQVLKWDGSNWTAAADGGGGGGGISLTDISVTTASAGSPALSYNNVSGVFTYTPPDLTPYAQTANLSIANWDAAHGWGNHASAGYLVATAQDKTNWNAAYGWGNHASAGYLTSLGDAIQDADFSSNGLMKRTAAGTYTSITDNSTNWNAAYAWGNHSAQGYLTTVALNGVSDVTITSPQTNDVLTYNGSAWVNSAPTGGGASVTISDTPPAASPGDLWWESDSGRLKIRYQDTDSTQWVDVAPPLSSALSTDAPANATSSGTLGDIRMDTDFIYVCVGTNAWKRVAISVW